jgi:FkbM family methyltransferase
MQGHLMLKQILIAVPTNLGINPETFQSIYNLEMPEACRADFQFFYGYRIDQIRNLIANYAINNSYDFVLFVDHDMIFEPDALQLLWKSDAAVVGGMYIQRIEGAHNIEAYGHNGGRVQAESVAAWIQTNGPEEVMQVQAVGFGCTLVSVEMLKKVGYPQFEYVPSLDHSQTQPEDIDFCKKVGKLGGRVVLDPRVRCGHIGKRVFTVQIPVSTTPVESSRVQAVADMDLLPQPMVDAIYHLPDDIKVIYDIGACVGHWARHAKARWPDSKIIMFDASRSVVPIMEASGNTWWCGVLSDKDQRVVNFYEDADNLGGNSYYKEMTDHYDHIKPRQDLGWTLDTVINHYNWPLPDLVKIDVQGAEFDVIKGGSAVLHHAKWVIVEVQKVQYNEGAKSWQQVHELLDRMGFTFLHVIHKTDVDEDRLYVKSK